MIFVFAGLLFVSGVLLGAMLRPGRPLPTTLESPWISKALRESARAQEERDR